MLETGARRILPRLQRRLLGLRSRLLPARLAWCASPRFCRVTPPRARGWLAAVCKATCRCAAAICAWISTAWASRSTSCLASSASSAAAMVWWRPSSALSLASCFGSAPGAASTKAASASPARPIFSKRAVSEACKPASSSRKSTCSSPGIALILWILRLTFASCSSCCAGATTLSPKCSP